MKNKDQQMLEEAYKQIQENETEMPTENEPGAGVDMDEQLIKQYYENFRKYENDEWTIQRWHDYCTVILGQLMEKNKDVFIRLKNR